MNCYNNAKEQQQRNAIWKYVCDNLYKWSMYSFEICTLNQGIRIYGSTVLTDCLFSFMQKLIAQKVFINGKKLENLTPNNRDIIHSTFILIPIVNALKGIKKKP